MKSSNGSFSRSPGVLSAAGFSLIETMITLAIASMLTYAVMSAANLSMRTGQLSNRQTSFTELSRGVRMLLDNPSTCPGFLRDPAHVEELLPYPGGLQHLSAGALYMSGSPIAVKGAMVPGSDLKVSDIDVIQDLTVPVDGFVDAAGVAFKRYYLNLAVTASVPGTAPIPLGGKKEYKLTFPFVGLVSQATGKMETCAGTQTSALFWVPLADLQPYYSALSQFSSTTVASNGLVTLSPSGPNCTPGDGNFIMATTIACHRWCGGCGPTPGSLCTGNFPSRGFTSGTSNLECNPAPAAKTGCICFR